MEVAKKYSHAFVGKTKLISSSWSEGDLVETVRFSPLPDESIMFYFEASIKPYFENASTNTNNFPFFISNGQSKFVLKLIKHDSKFSISQNCRDMTVDVKIFYEDGTLLNEYVSQHYTIDQMSPFIFDDVSVRVEKLQLKSIFGHTDQPNQNNRKLLGNLTLKFKMFFSGEISNSTLKCSQNFSKNLKSVYESSMFKDFVFNVGDKSFSAHKVILEAHSPVFVKMLFQDFHESKTNSVTIPDVKPEIFDLFLNYLYSGEIDDKSWNSVKDLYCLAHKYDVGILREDCADELILLISIDLVCEVLILAHTYDDSRIKSAAKKFAANHIKELITREDWKNLVAMHPIIGYDVIVTFVPT